MRVVRSYISLTKPRVVVLLQITAMCAILSHDLMENMSHNNIKLNGIDIELEKQKALLISQQYQQYVNPQSNRAILQNSFAQLIN